MTSDPDPREQLASIAASLRAYLEWQIDCGSSGIPRRPRAERSGGASEPPASEPHTPEPPEPAPPAEDPRTRATAHADTERAALPPIVIADPTPPLDARATAVPSPASPPAAPRTLQVLEEVVTSCTKCGLHEGRKNTVFARGNPEAKLCFVGEAPGADEDTQGIPFVGRAGQLLDKMIQAMGLDPSTEVYVCNIVKCRPPGNRRPEPPEIESCIPYLHEQLAVVAPKAIVALGNTAVAALLGTKLGITKVRGSWKLYRGKIPVMPTYHPSYLLRPSAQQAEAKRQVWEDLQTVMEELGIAKPARSH